MSGDEDVQRKWHRKASEEKLRLAVFDAMRESGAAAVSPTVIAQRAGLNKSLIYRYFGSVDVLVDETLRKHLIFPRPLDVVVQAVEGGDLASAIALTWAKIQREFRSHPELLDVLAWSIGNSDQMAVKALEGYRNFCEGIARELGPEPYLVPTIFGLIVMEVDGRSRKHQMMRRTTKKIGRN